MKMTTTAVFFSDKAYINITSCSTSNFNVYIFFFLCNYEKYFSVYICKAINRSCNT